MSEKELKFQLLVFIAIDVDFVLVDKCGVAVAVAVVEVDGVDGVDGVDDEVAVGDVAVAVFSGTDYEKQCQQQLLCLISSKYKKIQQNDSKH